MHQNGLAIACPGSTALASDPGRRCQRPCFSQSRHSPPTLQGLVAQSMQPGLAVTAMRAAHLGPTHSCYPAHACPCRRSRSRERTGGKGGVVIKRERSASREGGKRREDVREGSRRRVDVAEREGRRGGVVVKREPSEERQRDRESGRLRDRDGHTGKEREREREHAREREREMDRRRSREEREVRMAARSKAREPGLYFVGPRAHPGADHFALPLMSRPLLGLRALLGALSSTEAACMTE